MGMNVNGSNPRDNVRSMGASGKVNDAIDSASTIPKYTTADDFDVFSGANGLGQEAYMNASFHTSDMNSDARFVRKADEMQGDGMRLMNGAYQFATTEEKTGLTKLNAQEKEAAL